jgi:hypothetical protein
MSGEGKLIANLYESTVDRLEELPSRQILQKLNKIQVVLELAKGLNNESSLDYEIYSELQDKLLSLMTTFQTNDESKISKIKELREIFQALVSSGKILRESGAKPVNIEFTGKKYGGVRIFKITKD